MENTGGLYHTMKIPKNMSEEETLEKINLVVDRIAPKYSFSGYDVNDIKQEAFIICLDALNRYDQKRPLENFLAVNLSNRLKTLLEIITVKVLTPTRKRLCVLLPCLLKI